MHWHGRMVHALLTTKIQKQQKTTNNIQHRHPVTGVFLKRFVHYKRMHCISPGISNDYWLQIIRKAAAVEWSVVLHRQTHTH